MPPRGVYRVYYDYDFSLSESHDTYNRDREEFKMGYNSENFEPIDDTIDSLLRTVKLANNRVLNGRHSPHPDGEGVSVNIASIPFVHGLVNTGVSAVLKHKDFDRKEEKSTALEQAPRPHHSHPCSSLEVPVASLEKGQARLSNCEQRRKAGK